MAGETNTETVKIDIHVSGKSKISCGKDKINCTVGDGEGKCLLQWNSEPETWFHQVQGAYKAAKHKKLETSPDVSIYRVPESIKKTKRGAYDPLVVFLGPYHHKKHQSLTAMDKYKLQAVDKTLGRLGMTMEWVEEEVKELIQKIRNCYEDSAREWEDDPLVLMMIMDACFILEFLRMDLSDSSLVFRSDRGDNIKRREIMLDILKLENQIPFCILEMILKLELKDCAKVRNFLAELLCVCNGKYFHGYPFSNESKGKDIAKYIKRGPLHLLDLSRRVIADFLSNSHPGSGCESANCCYCYVHCGASGWRSQNRSSQRDSIPSAEKLQKAGIKLQPSTEGKIKFKHGYLGGSTLFLPWIIVDDYTEIFLRNLVAFEECQRHEKSPVKRAISLNMCIMDNLIDSKEDVGLFQRADIIKNYLGSEDEVAQIFNELCFGITIKDDFQSTFDMINKHYNNQWNKWIAEFKKEHCSRPWYVISFVAATLLLVMTLLQTIYTMKGYFHS